MLTLDHGVRRMEKPEGHSGMNVWYQAQITWSRGRGKGPKEFYVVSKSKISWEWADSWLGSPLAREKACWVLSVFEIAGPNDGNRAPVMNGNGHFITVGVSESTSLILLENIFWLPTLQNALPWTSCAWTKPRVGSDESKPTIWLSCISLTGPSCRWQSQRMLLSWPAHEHLRVTSLGGAPLVDSSLWGKPHWQRAWTRANQALSALGCSMQHYVLLF